jgi:hypothetical protein
MERRPDPDIGGADDESGRNRNEAPYIGGADAVEKTTYASDVHGAEADGSAARPVPVTATVGHDRGLGPVGWIALVLAALVLAAYAAGLFG